MRIKNLPNIITSIRIILVPLFILAFVRGKTAICAIIFALSGLTDAVDGYIARKFSGESNLGKILDPIADKLTYATVFFCLYSEQRLPLYFVVGFVAIQVLQGFGALFVYRSAGTVVKSNIPGKIAGFAMFLLCFSSLVFYDTRDVPLLTDILCLTVLAVIILSSTVYFIQYIGSQLTPNSKKHRH